MDTNEIDFAIDAGEGDKVKKANELKEKCIEQREKIKNSLKDLDEQNTNYGKFLANLKGEIREAELAIYRGLATGDSGFLTVMNKGRGVMDVLNKNERFFDKIIPAQNEVFEMSRMAFRENLNVKLPEIKLPEFSGDLKSWSSFFEEFSAAVDDQEQLYA
jgi:hypothetical protein